MPGNLLTQTLTLFYRPWRSTETTHLVKLSYLFSDDLIHERPPFLMKYCYQSKCRWWSQCWIAPTNYFVKCCAQRSSRLFWQWISLLSDPLITSFILHPRGLVLLISWRRKSPLLAAVIFSLPPISVSTIASANLSSLCHGKSKGFGYTLVASYLPVW